MSARTMALALLFTVDGTPLLATPRDDCALVASALGSPIDDYAFEEGDVFSMERHQFGALTCYVNAEGVFDSLYRGDVPIAEDGLLR